MNFGNILSKVGNACSELSGLSALKGEAPKAKDAELSALRKIAIVGNPNVGKSVLFGRLTGAYATVSNYPGTTVEVFHGTTKIGEEEFHVIDTPGMYGLLPITEEERVARAILLEEKPCVVIHVIDAKNIERMLPLTFQLMEARLRLVLVLNMFDEAQKIGMKINVEQLERDLKIPVAATVSTTGKGVDVLRGRIEAYVGTKK
ncbi:MAG: FeoB small GTPase domain-containing protein [Sedimentisphaerales bacterium]|nr:FeoB small GTPase domain-containing protein [Sedimentisphaerales bacterium]